MNKQILRYAIIFPMELEHPLMPIRAYAITAWNTTFITGKPSICKWINIDGDNHKKWDLQYDNICFLFTNEHEANMAGMTTIGAIVPSASYLKKKFDDIIPQSELSPWSYKEEARFKRKVNTNNVIYFDLGDNLVEVMKSLICSIVPIKRGAVSNVNDNIHCYSADSKSWKINDITDEISGPMAATSLSATNENSGLRVGIINFGDGMYDVWNNMGNIVKVHLGKNTFYIGTPEKFKIFIRNQYNTTFDTNLPIHICILYGNHLAEKVEAQVIGGTIWSKTLCYYLLRKEATSFRENEKLGNALYRPILWQIK